MDTPEPGRGTAPVLAAERIGKSYGSVHALNGVSLQLFPGEVLAVVGDNGAGKSTLLGILAGTIRPSFGTVFVAGTAAEFKGALEAREVGIEAVYQDLALALDRDVVSNLFMGRELVAKGVGRFVGWLDRRSMRFQGRRALDTVGISIPSVTVRCAELSGGQRQAVAVARALMYGSKILLLDEPTAALAMPEQKRLGELVAGLRAHQVAVLIVSHNLPQVLDISDRVIVLRQGAKVADLESKSVDVDELIAYMTGAKIASIRE